MKENSIEFVSDDVFLASVKSVIRCFLFFWGAFIAWYFAFCPAFCILFSFLVLFVCLWVDFFTGMSFAFLLVH